MALSVSIASAFWCLTGWISDGSGLTVQDRQVTDQWMSSRPIHQDGLAASE